MIEPRKDGVSYHSIKKALGNHTGIGVNLGGAIILPCLGTCFRELYRRHCRDDFREFLVEF